MTRAGVTALPYRRARAAASYGYKVHVAVDVATDLPLAWRTETARASQQTFALLLIDATRERGFAVGTAIVDGGYDTEPIHDGCMDRGVLPVTPLREAPAVKRGEHKAPCCRHGVWTFAGADFKRKATKWRCPTGERKPASIWIKASRLHPLIPRESQRSMKLHRSRGAVEREFGRLKNEWAMAPLRVRHIERVRLHVDLTLLAKLACRLPPGCRARGLGRGITACERPEMISPWLGLAFREPIRHIDAGALATDDGAG